MFDLTVVLQLCSQTLLSADKPAPTTNQLFAWQVAPRATRPSHKQRAGACKRMCFDGHALPMGVDTLPISPHDVGPRFTCPTLTAPDIDVRMGGNWTLKASHDVGLMFT